MRVIRRCSLLVSLVFATSLAPALTPAAFAGSGGANVVRKPTGGTPKGALVLFIPGTNLTPAQSTGFLDYAASQGFHAIGVSYKNSKSVAKICKKSGDACFGQVRREIVSGTDSSPLIDVKPEASILGRLKTQLLDLAADAPDPDGWDQYVNGSQIILNKVFPTGHSQGAGHAAIIGIDRTVYRVGLFAGPNDVVRGTGEVPSWTSGARTTSSSKWRAMSHDDDNSLEDQESAWDNFNLLSTSSTRQILSGKIGDPHLGVVVDGYLPNGIQTNWKALLGL